MASKTIVDGSVVGSDGGVVTMEVGGQKIQAAGAADVGERVRVCLRPEDVTLSPGDALLPASSARNRLTGTVAQVVAAGAQARVVVDCGFPLVALVTHRSVEELGLVAGARVTAAFKATATHLIRLARNP